MIHLDLSGLCSTSRTTKRKQALTPVPMETIEDLEQLEKPIFARVLGTTPDAQLHEDVRNLYARISKVDRFGDGIIPSELRDVLSSELDARENQYAEKTSEACLEDPSAVFTSCLQSSSQYA